MHQLLTFPCIQSLVGRVAVQGILLNTMSRCECCETLKLVLVRHGESEWNKDNRFCGWVDVNLSKKGFQESSECAKALKLGGYQFDVVFTSLLKRAHQTVEIVLKEIGQPTVAVEKLWQLNERHYGALTGYNKADIVAKYGNEQVHVWRRSYDVPPPPMDPGHSYYSEITKNPKFAGIPIPDTESLKDTSTRVVECWDKIISPVVRKDHCVLIVAHGTSLRGLVKHLEDMSDHDVSELNLPNGNPFVYKLDRSLRPIGPKVFLSDDETVRQAMEKVAAIDPTNTSNKK